jgi:hypothetical protein
LIHWLRLHVLHLDGRWGRHDCWSWSGLMGVVGVIFLGDDGVDFGWHARFKGMAAEFMFLRRSGQ